MNSKLCLPLLLIFFPLIALSDEPMRTFTDAKGRTVRAALVSVQSDQATLRLENGKQYTMGIATLSAGDIEYIKTTGLVMPKAASAVTQPTLPQPPPASSPSEIQVKLPLVPHELAARFPEGRSFESNWSTKKPSNLSGLPIKLTSPLFNTHFFSATRGGRQQNYHLVLDDPNGSSPRLFVDSNGNGNLNDDQVAVWRAGKFRRQGWKRASVGQGRAIIKLKLGDETHEVGLIVYYAPSPKKNEHDSLVELDYARMGFLKVEGKSILAALIDRSSADFSALSSSFCLDLNNDGLFSLKDEIFPVRESIRVGGQNYRLSGLDPSGADFQLVKTQ